MKLALAQTDILWEDKHGNELVAERLIKLASESNAQLILFPEMCLTGFSMNVFVLGEERFSSTTAFFSAMAERYTISIGFGYIELPPCSVNGRNNYAVVHSSGSLLNVYSKIHPFSYGRETEFYEGGSEIEGFELNDWWINTFICYDLRFPEIFQIASRKAQLITVAANWPKDRINHWEALLKARAIENQCYVAGINRTGCGDNIIYSGNSMVADPSGNIIARAGSSEELILCEIDIKDVYNIRKAFRLKDDRKEALYASYYKTGDD